MVELEGNLGGYWCLSPCVGVLGWQNRSPVQHLSAAPWEQGPWCSGTRHSSAGAERAVAGCGIREWCLPLPLLSGVTEPRNGLGGKGPLRAIQSDPPCSEQQHLQPDQWLTVTCGYVGKGL